MSSSSSSSSSSGPSASLLYGVGLPQNQFWEYLLRNDTAFAKQMLKYIRSSERAFRKYEIQDIIDDIHEDYQDRIGKNGDLYDQYGAHYTRKGNQGGEDLQCADDISDGIWSDGSPTVFEIEAICTHDRKARTFPSTLLSGYKIQSKYIDGCGLITVGVEIEVYKNGTPVDQRVELKPEWTSFLQPWADHARTKVKFFTFEP
jgi:hypothetical protein